MTRIKKSYLLKQKLAGLFLMIATVIVALFGNCDATVGLLFIPVGLYFIITNRVILNRYNYVYEIKERKRQQGLR